MYTTPDATHTTPPQGPQGANGMQLHAPLSRVPGGFWRRFVATLVDGAILSVLTMPLNLVFGALMGFSTTMSGGELQANSAFMVLTYAGSYLLSLVAIFFYYGWFYKTKGATPGKRLMRLRVAYFDTGTHLTYWRAFARETFGKLVSSLLLGIGFLLVAFRRDKRGLHDLLLNTHVTYEPK